MSLRDPLETANQLWGPSAVLSSPGLPQLRDPLEVANQLWGQADLIGATVPTLAEAAGRPTFGTRQQAWTTPPLVDVDQVPLGTPPEQAPALMRGLWTGLAEQNPQTMGEGLEALSYVLPVGGEALKGVSQRLKTFKVGKEYQVQGRPFREDPSTWAGEQLGLGLASTFPSLVSGAAGALVGTAAGPWSAFAGSLAGASMSSYLLNMGDLYASLKQAGMKEEEAARSAIVGALPITALDVWGMEGALGGLTRPIRKTVMDNIAKRILKQGVKGTLFEGGTEGVQQLIQEAQVAEQTGKKVDIGAVAQAGVVGAMTGGLMGAVGGVARPQIEPEVVPVTDETRRRDIRQKPITFTQEPVLPAEAERVEAPSVAKAEQVISRPEIVQLIKDIKAAGQVPTQFLAEHFPNRSNWRLTKEEYQVAQDLLAPTEKVVSPEVAPPAEITPQQPILPASTTAPTVPAVPAGVSARPILEVTGTKSKRLTVTFPGGERGPVEAAQAFGAVPEKRMRYGRKQGRWYGPATEANVAVARQLAGEAESVPVEPLVKPKRRTASDWLNEKVNYGGEIVSRADVERDLDAKGITGPARLVYAQMPVVEDQPKYSLQPLGPGELRAQVGEVEAGTRHISPTVQATETTGSKEPWQMTKREINKGYSYSHMQEETKWPDLEEKAKTGPHERFEIDFVRPGEEPTPPRLRSFKNQEEVKEAREKQAPYGYITGPAGPERIYYRLGRIPKSLSSYNSREDRREVGVSVYLTPVVGSMYEGRGRRWFYGPGRQVGVGGDEESLIIPTGEWKEYPGHRKAVKQALAEGKTVPVSVLAEYPKLKSVVTPAGPPGDRTGRLLAAVQQGLGEQWEWTRQDTRQGEVMIGTTKSGHRLAVSVTEAIPLTPEAAAEAYPGIDLGATNVAGAFDPRTFQIKDGTGKVLVDGTGILYLSKQHAEATTPRHEILHAAADLVLTSAEKTSLLRRYAGKTEGAQWEAAAEAYVHWTPTQPDTLFGKVYEWAKRVMERLTGAPAATFRKIESGEVWRRPSVSRAGVLQAGNATVTAPGVAAAVERPEIKGFHGTPHTFTPEEGAPLGRFRKEKVGTGEGAAAYGYGVAYVAGRTETAETYQDTLAKKTNAIRYKGTRISPNATYEWVQRAFGLDDAGTLALYGLAVNRYKGINGTKRELAKFASELASTEETKNLYQRAINWIDDNIADLGDTEQGGNFYHVEILAEPEEFLDWDRPLSEQSAVVRKALAPQIQYWKKTLSKYAPSTDTGETAYREMSATLKGKQAASEYLSSLGIKGIRYLDQGSRPSNITIRKSVEGKFTAEDGNGSFSPEFDSRQELVDWIHQKQTYNYVVFREEDLRITGRNGEELTLPEALTEQQGQPPAGQPQAQLRSGDEEQISGEQQVTQPELALGDVVTPEKNAEYLQAAESGDTQRAQELVDEAAKQAGYTVGPVFHGTTLQDPTELSPFYAVETSGAVFLTDNEDVAAIFTLPREYGETVYYDEDGNELEPGRVVSTYLRLKNPMILEGEDAQRATDDTTYQGQVVRRAQSAGHDGLILRDVQEGLEEQYPGTTYAVFSGEQIKSAESITYNDQGKIIPLRQRFNRGTADIRYSLVSSVRQALTPPVKYDPAQYPELAAAQQQRAESKALEKRYKGLVAKVAPGSFAETFFKNFQSFTGKKLKTVEEVTNDLAALELLAKQTEKLTGQPQLGTMDPIAAAKRFRGARGLAEVMLESWGRLVAKAGATPGKMTPQELADFDLFLQAQGIVRREGILHERFPDKDITELNPGGKTAAEAKQQLAELQQAVGAPAYQRMERAYAGIGKFWRVMLKYVKDAGLIGETAYQNILHDQIEYGDYVGPFDIIEHAVQRMEKSTQLPRDLSVYSQDAVKMMEGTVKLNRSILEASTDKVYRTVQLAERNKVMRKIYALRNVAPQMKEIILPLKKGTDAPQGFAPVSFFVSGKRIEFAVPEPVAAAINGLSPGGMHWMFRAFLKSSNLLRMGATAYAPTFPIRNWFRDTGTQAIRAENPIYPWDLKGLQALGNGLWTAAAGKENRLYREWRKWGGSYSGRIAQFAPAQRVEKLTGLGQGWLGTVLDLLQAGEEATRLAVFQRSIQAQLEKAGAKVPTQEQQETAALESREATIDFAQGGKIFRFLNAFAPFTNARMQGFRTVYLAGVPQHPLRATSFALAGAAAAAMLVAWNRDEYGDLLDDIPEYKRRDNWVRILGTFKDEEGNTKPLYTTIPKPDLLRPVAALTEDFLTYLYTEKKDVWKSLMATLGEVSPIDLAREGEFAPVKAIMQFAPPVLRAATEVGLNRAIYQDQYIVPPEVERERLPKHQYRASTSKGARLLGDYLNWSPAKIDHFMRAVGGEVGGLVLRLPELVTGVPAERRELKGEVQLGPLALKESWTYAPVSRGLLSSAAGQQKNQLFDLLMEVQREQGSAAFVEKEKIRLALRHWPEMQPRVRAQFLQGLEPSERERFLQMAKEEIKGFGEGQGVYRLLRTFSVSQGERSEAIVRMMNELYRRPEERVSLIRELGKRNLIDEEVLGQLLQALQKGQITPALQKAGP